jgi:AbrB family looped-hinge helix DNA binding protein
MTLRAVDPGGEHKDEPRLRSAIRVGAKSRIVLPAAIRDALGVREGDLLVAEVEEDGSVRLESMRRIADAGIGVVAHIEPGHDWASEFIEQRRREAAREP